MLIITVDIASHGVRHTLAEATVGNISDLAHVSDYAVYAKEGPNPVANTAPWQSRGMIAGHDRRSSVWSLVEKVARWAAAEAEKLG